MAYGLGIDYGTSHTVVVVEPQGGKPEPMLFDASLLLPSGVYAPDAGGLVVGTDAERGARIDPGRYEPNPKRHIDERELLLGTAEVPVAAAIGAVLARAAGEAQRTMGGPPTRVVLSHPAEWRTHRRAVLLEAAARAGLEEPELVPEPVAAAAHFTGVLGQRVDPGSTVVVYDFGGGTFDVNVLRRRPDQGWEVLATAGLDDVGGVDLDAALVAHVGAVAAARDADGWRRIDRPATATDRKYRRLLWADVRAAKEQLSRASSTLIPVPVLEIDVPVTREEFEALARPWLDRTVALTTSTLFGAGVSAKNLAGVFLVGGSSRIPLVGTLLHRALGVPPVALEQPELVVALGTLRVAAVQAGAPSPPTPAPRGPVPSVAGPVPSVASPASGAAAPVPNVAGADRGGASSARASAPPEVGMPTHPGMTHGGTAGPAPAGTSAHAVAAGGAEGRRARRLIPHPGLLAIVVLVLVAGAAQAIQIGLLSAHQLAADPEVYAHGLSLTGPMPFCALYAAIVATAARRWVWAGVTAASLIGLVLLRVLSKLEPGLTSWPWLGWAFHADRLESLTRPATGSFFALALAALPLLAFAVRGPRAPVTSPRLADARPARALLTLSALCVILTVGGVLSLAFRDRGARATFTFRLFRSAVERVESNYTEYTPTVPTVGLGNLASSWVTDWPAISFWSAGWMLGVGVAVVAMARSIAFAQLRWTAVVGATTALSLAVGAGLDAASTSTGSFPLAGLALMGTVLVVGPIAYAAQELWRTSRASSQESDGGPSQPADPHHAQHVAR
ncbi:Hsp70 family protein [Cryptosporangium aurantiacum]|uniref:Hsp70 protein n=1 Tax=Cryptosporangium aurantiacum TaxID=134849 RepID=A0A1M7R372_9ACTN|nr:Hsp70 family protein [Cryptosporangium aurantiacum]SHN39291.1 Hsp70 protein [Cryptosporangium aurantiacum]